MTEDKKVQVTLALKDGRMSPQLLKAVGELVCEYGLTPYVTTLQNMRLLGIPEAVLEEVKKRVLTAGGVIKEGGRFPLPKVCVGRVGCKLGIVDTAELTSAIWERFGGLTGLKPKLKLAVAACPASCSGALLADIGVVATRSGFAVYAGGMGGPFPKVGRRIARRLDIAGVVATLEKLLAFHQEKTSKKQRLFKLIDDPDFPFAGLGEESQR